jgi:hypothetical protein
MDDSGFAAGLVNAGGCTWRRLSTVSSMTQRLVQHDAVLRLTTENVETALNKQ